MEVGRRPEKVLRVGLKVAKEGHMGWGLDQACWSSAWGGSSVKAGWWVGPCNFVHWAPSWL